ncbi:MAG: heavy metal translocating P-type ATPase [Lactococcus raffinolactis]|jgi:heavy metal translocating P-type ATPase|uniref:Cd(2+)-exporting ATPase n=1 Tax=Pseudolactococcus raffinolactis TaxID=1366 RepID=A0A2A5SHD2_9LACT|nr:heavy metal translocating P-type ATPase [Lactococcus raffinolactis]MBP6300821.1 cadmium-translocating P-type ATPase [Lactococcus sp.]ATC62036.1 heavy metal translocating P-type ATPase [Lactococcus raffinolactis]MBW9329818.1 cadmium-translocating P-type ATPase [Lactococcus raffinolactis]MDG4960738.1 heavy metal translocating P-type ATPase [Lactococcus raffinolactis]MDN5414341.1 cadmium-translocating P-type ATPase [Lactococcus raffinolactis]
MKNWQKLTLTFMIAIIAIILDFGFKQPTMTRVLVTIAGAILAISMFIEMIKTLRSGRYGVDLLAIIAIISTLVIGQYWASLIIIVMLVGGESLEDYAAHRASRELHKLLENSPTFAHKKVGDSYEDTPIDAIEIDDVFLVKASEVVPIDGVVLEGDSWFDESSLTGESEPVTKAIGDDVLSGSINGETAVLIQASKKASDSQYQKIVQLVKESEATPAQFVRLADRYAVPFTIVSLLIAGAAWLISGDMTRFAEVLVVASPCPLILAAPIAFVGGMSRSSRNGLLVKNGTTIEKLSLAKTVAFDKTGTLTTGILQVKSITPEKTEHSEDDLLQIAAALEIGSNHILAKSLVKLATEKDLALLAVADLRESTGLGLSGVIDNKTYRIGRANFANAEDEKVNGTAVFISEDDVFIGKILFEDKIRPESQHVIERLKAQDVQHILMLTGDNQKTAELVAGELGITEMHAGLMPSEKIGILKELPETHRPMVMVGDGVNDAPALALSDVGIALGASGSTVASESADVVVLRNDLNLVPESIKISRETMKVAKEAVLIGIFICIALMLIASTGILPAIIGALLQEVIDTVSILYALKALKDRK